MREVREEANTHKQKGVLSQLEDLGGTAGQTADEAQASTDLLKFSWGGK